MAHLFDTILQNPRPFLLVVSFMIFGIYSLWVHCYKLKRMFDNDARFEKRDEKGIIEKGYHRNIWDLSLFPALSKLFFANDWKTAVATYLLVFFLIMYMVTKEQWLAELVKINFGLVIGALISKNKADGN